MSSRRIEFDGQEYPTYKEMCAELGINYPKFFKYKVKYGLEQAITLLRSENKLTPYVRTFGLNK